MDPKSDVQEITKRIKKSIQLDKRNTAAESVNPDLDIKDFCLGVRNMKKDFTRIPFNIRDVDGENVQKISERQRWQTS